MAVAQPVLKVEVDFVANPTAGHNDILQGQDDVTSFWRMNSASTFLDSVGSNPGVIEGTLTTTTGPLLYDTDLALAFDGSSDAVYVPTAVNLTSKGNMTAAGWLYLPSLPAGTRDVVAKRGAWLIQVNSTGNLIATLKDDTSTATATGSTVLATSTWYHVGLVYDSTNIYLYLNGGLEASAVYSAGWESGYQPIRFAKTPSTSAPTWQSSQTANGNNVNVTCNAPASIATGDFLLAHFNYTVDSATVTTTPSGWNLIGSSTTTGSNTTRVYYKIATASEPASYTWVMSSLGDFAIGVSRFTGVDAQFPFANPIYVTTTASGTSHAAGTHLPNVDNNMVVSLFAMKRASGAGATTWTESTGTERYDTTSADDAVAMSTQTQTNATSVSCTGTSSIAGPGAAIMIILGGTGQNFLAAWMKDWSFENTARSIHDLAARYESRNSGVGTWVDLTSMVKSVDTKGCGRQYERGQIEGGTATVTFTDKDRKLDPSNTSSPYWPNVKKNRKIRITCTFAGTTYQIFSGFIERWPPSWDVPRYNEVTITAGDGFKPLNLAGVSGTLAIGYSGTQIAKLLNKALWPQADRAIDTGSYVMAANTIAANSFAKGEIDTIVDSELGLFFVDAARLATFHDSAHRGSQTRSTTSQATFRWAGTGEIEYQGLVPSDDDDKITNNWQVTPDASAVGSAMQEVFDHVSIAQNFPHTQSRITRLASNTAALSQANNLLDNTSDAALRFDSITIVPTTTLGFQKTLALTISDRVTVVASPGASGSTVTKDCFVESIGSWSIKAGLAGSWSVSFPLSPVSSGNYYATIVRDGPISYWRMDTVA